MMNNCPTTEEVLRWRDWFVSLDLPTLRKAQEQIKQGSISHTCTCGCRSFSVEHAPDASLEPVIVAKSAGPFCELAFSSNAQDEVNVMLWADQRGVVTTVDITISGANNPWPDFNVIPGELIGIWEVGS
jgi:hypothetical protein